MGLSEKRAVQEFAKNSFPTHKQNIEAAVGFPVEIDVKWDTLAEEGYEHMYAEAFPKVYFLPITNALKAICSDDMGRDAVKSVLKKIEILNSNAFSNENGLSFAGGVLKFDHKPITNVDSVDERTTYITKLLEKSL